MDGSGERRGRRRSIVLFFVAGPVTLLALLFMATGSLGALPFAIVSSALMALAGYRIWRIDHPDESACVALRQRVGWYGGVVVDASISMIDSDTVVRHGVRQPRRNLERFGRSLTATGGDSR